MIDPKMIEVIEKRCNQLDYEVPQWWIESASRALHDAGFRRVPGLLNLLTDIQWNATDEHFGDSQCPECLNGELDGHSQDCRLDAIRKLMLGGE